MLTVTPAIFAFLAVIVHGIPVSPISNLDFVEDRARAEAGRLRFFSANSSVKLVDHALARRSNVHSGWWSVATGDRCGPGEGRRFYSKGKTSSICRLSMDSGQWPVSHSDLYNP
ncbi:hypothetical protein BJ742DRAFT_837154 [Cladochytrium replicatum]|nr:hypothetical protein BJ742DRAFT_837154 [Cladochytrium replicatum]